MWIAALIEVVQAASPTPLFLSDPLCGGPSDTDPLRRTGAYRDPPPGSCTAALEARQALCEGVERCPVVREATVDCTTDSHSHGLMVPKRGEAWALFFTNKLRQQPRFLEISKASAVLESIPIDGYTGFLGISEGEPSILGTSREGRALWRRSREGVWTSTPIGPGSGVYGARVDNDALSMVLHGGLTLLLEQRLGESSTVEELGPLPDYPSDAALRNSKGKLAVAYWTASASGEEGDIDLMLRDSTGHKALLWSQPHQSWEPTIQLAGERVFALLQEGLWVLQQGQEPVEVVGHATQYDQSEASSVSATTGGFAVELTADGTTWLGTTRIEHHTEGTSATDFAKMRIGRYQQGADHVSGGLVVSYVDAGERGRTRMTMAADGHHLHVLVLCPAHFYGTRLRYLLLDTRRLP